MYSWSKFNSNLLRWHSEIKEPLIAQEFLTYCIEHALSKPEEVNVKDEEYKTIQKYSKYIPSLKARTRKNKFKIINMPETKK